MTSIIILCCNQLRYAQLCVESILRHTRSPYELILVDNGSSDETPAYLESLRQRPGPARVVVLCNESNLGFAAGNNQALAHDRGEDVLFPDFDTIVLC